jgi:putative acetyltransferase
MIKGVDRTIALERADQPEIVTLIDALDAFQKPLYPAESHHGIDIAELIKPNVLFAVVRNAQSMAMGCGAIVLQKDYAELKRMYVPDSYRGMGVGKALLQFLEQQAAASQCRLLRLETGVRQPEALRLYERAGYRRCAPFGNYQQDPLSVFMEKRLQAGGVP